MAKNMAGHEIEAVYPLSPMQEGMLFHSLLEGQRNIYVEQLVCTLSGVLDPLIFHQAWRAVVKRHAVLRTSFLWEDAERTRQVVYKDVKVPFLYGDWRELTDPEKQQRIEEVRLADQDRGFELGEAPLMRLALYRWDDKSWQFIWTHHHLLLDGWSMPLVLEDFCASYKALEAGVQPSFPHVRPFKDYIDWCGQQSLSNAERFWRRTLQGFRIPTALGINRISLDTNARAGEPCKETLFLSAGETRALQEFCKAEHLTLNTVVQGAYALLLSHYSREQDVVFGVTVSGRPTVFPDADSMVGMFINTLPLRVEVERQTPVREFLHRIQNANGEMQQFEYSPLAKIQVWSDVPPGTPLFQSILVFENYPVDSSLLSKLGNVGITKVEASGGTNYPLAIVAAVRRELALDAVYADSLFDAAAIRSMLEHLRHLLSGLADHPGATIGTLTLSTAEERVQLLSKWNDTSTVFPEGDVPVHRMFERCAAATPESIAIEFNGLTITYGELNRRANCVGQYLRSRGVGPDALVGLYFERSMEMIVGILGILKAGAAYVPFDPESPQERLSFMLSDSKACLVLTHSTLDSKLPQSSPKAILLDTEWEEIQQAGDEDLQVMIHPDNLAYVIYTSGSTGRPKGVLVPHRGLSNFVCGQRVGLRIEASAHICQFASVSFDASAAEIFPALTTGAVLQIVPGDVARSAEELTGLLLDRRTSLAILPPTLLAVLDEHALPVDTTVISAGESCSPELFVRWSKDRRFVNAYGPTETTIGATWHDGPSTNSSRASVPIGRPMPNVRAYVLDDTYEPVPIGVMGELFIGGPGVTRGYLGRADLTAEKFLPDLFGPIGGERMYRTGDLVRRLPDGELEFVGRSDRQVKIRGVRIELGEIEERLRMHPGVGAAVVDARRDPRGERRLVGYVVPLDRQKADVREIREYLRSHLPSSMIPEAIVLRDSLPVNLSGKVDVAALPDPGSEDLSAQDRRDPPVTATEELLAGAWSEILGVEGISRQDDFFALGGHSLRMTQLISRIREIFSIDLPLRSAFEARSLETLSDLIDRARTSGSVRTLIPPLESTARDGDIPLSFSQQRLWFLEQLEPGSPAYNIPAGFRVSGPLKPETLRQCVSQIIARHEVLRTRFVKRQGEPCQHIEQTIEPPFTFVDLSDLTETERSDAVHRRAIQDSQQCFDLEKGPLFRVTVLKCADDDHVVVLTMHHIIADGWSVSILIKEISALYEAGVEGTSPDLPLPPVQYADFARWQRAWLQGEVLEDQLSFWSKQLEDMPTFLDLPTDHPRPPVQTSRGGTLSLDLPVEFKTVLESVCQQEGVTLYMLLLSAFAALLHRYCRQDSIAIGSPVANRRHVQTEDMIGFFVNTIVLRIAFPERMTIRELLRESRATCLDAFAHQDLPFEKLVESLQPTRDMSRSPLFQAAFVHQNFPRQALHVAGLTFQPMDVDTGTSKFDLTLTTVDAGEGLRADLEFSSDLFEPSTVSRILRHYGRVLEQFVANLDSPVDQISFMDDDELQQLLVERNRTAASYPDDRTVHEWFEEEVEKHPDAVALSCGAADISYRDLNSRANKLAARLRSMGVGPEKLVGLCFDRSPDMIVAILGVLKAGGAFVPLDPTYPKDRLAYMVEDSHVQVVISQHAVIGSLPDGLVNVLFLESGSNGLSEESGQNLQNVVVPEGLAYVIYTSGSTGKPKGTMLQHRGLCNLAAAQGRLLGVGPGSRILQFASLSFDASVWETVMALLNGGTLVIAPREVLSSTRDLADLFSTARITNVTLPPSVLAVVPEMKCPNLATIITAGERCPRDLVDRWAPGRTFVNAYGPTETTVCASLHYCLPNKQHDPPIGRPITNVDLYIVDEFLQPVPDGVAGELLIGGVSLARGYLGRPDLTAQKFIPCPFGAKVGERLYRSGDLCRYLTDGSIEYVGRIDQQVKVRGFRIELGEIEAVLDTHPMVREAVVIVREDAPGDRKIVAYLEPRDGASPSRSDLRQFLRTHLPDYMIPSAFVLLDTFPLSAAGKIDRKALPLPDPSRREVESTYEAPRTALETTLARECADLLGLERVGIRDSFFEIGGHSLLATRLMARVHDLYQVDLPLRSLFEAPTIAELADRIAAESKVSQPALNQIEEKLQVIDGLSDTEVHALLEKMKQSSIEHGETLG